MQLNKILGIEKGHETRFASGLLMLLSMMMGIVDALAPDDTVKAFGWLFLNFSIMPVVFYELLWSDIHENINKIAVALTSVYIGSNWGIWNVAWLFFSVLSKGFTFVQNGRIGIFPNLSLDVFTWSATSILAIILVIISHLYIERQSKKA